MADFSEAEMCKFDEVFLGVLQHCGKIEPFLESVFNFLSRRTDFFRLMHDKHDKFGFPPRVAENIVRNIFRKYQERVCKDDLYREEMQNQATNKVVPQPTNEVEVVSTTTENNEQKIEENAEEKQSLNKTAPSEKATPSDEPADAYNGSVEDTYSWSQTLTDVDIKVPVPAQVKKSKDVTIKISSNALKVSLNHTPNPECGFTKTSLINNELTNRVKVDDSMWSLEPGKHVSINLEKAVAKWWTAVVKGGREIDKSSIDTTQHVETFDEQTQSDIRKVMYDQQQKMMGKPTSEEQKTHDLLKKAWDAKGSPFKGTPFDPSVINTDGGFPPTQS